MLQYGEMCSLGTQLQYVLDTIDRRNLHIIFLEDMKKDSEQVFKNLINFLNINASENINFEVRNKALQNRFDWLKKKTKNISYTVQKLKLPTLDTGLVAGINKLNNKPFNRPELSPQFRRHLKEYFKEEVLLLGDLAGRNLNHWVEVSNA